MGITHPFVSGKPDGDDTSLVRPTDWNAEHTIADAWDDALALESNLGAPSTGLAPSRTLYDGPNNSGDWSLFHFPNNATRYLQSAVQLPHGYHNGTSLYWHVHFIPDGDITNGQTVIFKAEVTLAAVNGTFGNEVTYTSTYTSSGTNGIDKHLMTTSVEIPATSMAGSGFVLARIYRDQANDTATVGTWLLGSDYHIKVHRFGSATENPTT